MPEIFRIVKNKACPRPVRIGEFQVFLPDLSIRQEHLNFLICQFGFILF
ncbi:Uncharacterized protein dnm_100280 [Desulfonema magnum]|uniref:Uncharacterized protein n=1 Tax=Desulfonema magnum TaxID=45655 RepID=A0A975BYV8_9BACT|nr:Uncharacterized protein dnm_100280 [Desulfonema magnum]